MSAMREEQVQSELSAEEAAALHVVGPMPRDLELLTDLDRRQRVSHFSSPRYPFPVPNGWFIVAESADLALGEVRALHYFDRDLVLFRGEDGSASVLDAHCQHLGAHLAVGGKVEGACIRCPFHGWRFEGETGKCDDIPYGEITRIPPKAHTRSYRTIERNQMIWVWFHAEDGEPFYEVSYVSLTKTIFPVRPGVAAGGEFDGRFCSRAGDCRRDRGSQWGSQRWRRRYTRRHGWGNRRWNGRGSRRRRRWNSD
jgi:nitrite reductase/ring-hydroxylating ferredoxin subunit